MRAQRWFKWGMALALAMMVGQTSDVWAMPMSAQAHSDDPDDVVHFVDFRPAAGSTISDDQPEISVLIYLTDDNWRYSDEFAGVEVFGCGSLREGDDGFSQVPESPQELPVHLRSLATEVWRVTVDLEDAGCTLEFPSGMDVIVTLSVSSQHRFIPITLGTNFDAVSWSFEVDDPTAPPIAFDPPPPLLIENLSPSTVNAGSTVTVRGQGFTVPSTLNRFQGARAYMSLDDGFVPVSTTVESSTALRFSVPDGVTCGNHLVQIRNPEVLDFVGSNVQHQSVPIGLSVRCPLEVSTPPTPEVDAVVPERATRGTTVSVNGRGFLAAEGDALSIVLLDGDPVETEYVSESHLRFQVPDDAACREHDLQVRGPGQRFDSPPRLSNVASFGVNCDDQASPVGEAFFDATSLEVVGTPELGANVRFRGVVANTGDAEGGSPIELFVDASAIGAVTRTLGPDQQLTFTSDAYTFERPGNYEVKLRTPDDALTRIVRIPSSDDGGNAATGLTELDTNGNCVLDTPEFLGAIDAWITEAIGNDLFFDAIDAWISESNICGSAAGLEESAPLNLHARLAPSGRALHLATSDPMATLSHVEVFNLAGETVFEARPDRPRMSWHLHGTDGRPIPNGVYLYRAVVQDARGERGVTGIHRIVILR